MWITFVATSTTGLKICVVGVEASWVPSHRRRLARRRRLSLARLPSACKHKKAETLFNLFSNKCKHTNFVLTGVSDINSVLLDSTS